MIDYLELAAAGGADVLLEEQRRADAAFVVGQAAQHAGQTTAEEYELLTQLRTVQEQAAAANSRSVPNMGDGSIVRRRAMVDAQPGQALLEGSAASQLRRDTRQEWDAAQWAGQLAQTLQRDSRRFDAGFFLY